MKNKAPYLYLTIFIILIVQQASCYASKSPKGMVNVLARYNYSNIPEISSLVKDKCGVEISYDRYYRKNECFRRISTVWDYYDIVIFPGSLYEFVKGKIVNRRSNLSKVVGKYDNRYKNFYLSYGYPGNIVYFTLSLTGFTWNSKIIKLLATDKIFSMFEKAKDNIVIVLNSPAGVWSLIDSDQNVSNGLQLSKMFKETIQDANVYITNGYNELYEKDNFAFAFQRSGDAVLSMMNSKNEALKFLIHPDYSYVSVDLMAELNSRKETQCVSRVLASKEALDIIQRKTYYLSPYRACDSFDDQRMKDVCQCLVEGACKKRWLDPFIAKGEVKYSDSQKRERISELREMWEEIHRLPKIIQNHSVVLKESK